MTSPLAPISSIVNAIKNGHMVIIVDDERRENEGDLVIPAALTTPEHINFMATHGRGLICLAMSDREIDRLELPLMSEKNDCKLGTAFTVSIDARENVTTGISAYDRAHTIQTACNPNSRRADLAVPGHIFPLRAHTQGLASRSGHTEAAVELAKLAEQGEAGVICEIMKDDGTMARLPDLIEFSEKHNLLIGSIAALTEYLYPKKEIA